MMMMMMMQNMVFNCLRSVLFSYVIIFGLQFRFVRLKQKKSLSKLKIIKGQQMKEGTCPDPSLVI